MRLSRWIAAIPVVAVSAFALSSAADSQPSRSLPVRGPAFVLVRQDVTAAERRKLMELRVSVTKLRRQTWVCQDEIGAARSSASVSVWRLPASVPYRTWTVGRWQQRAAGCHAVLSERKRQWDWGSWLPDKWQRIGACETGYGKRPGNWAHNSGAFQGAFGFATRSWDDFRPAGYPSEAYLATPWQQYQVALEIYRRYGLSGWGCRGA